MNNPTGIKARNGDMIHVGDTVESVQGTSFEVVETVFGFGLQTEDGRLWELESYMSPNLWIINENRLNTDE